MHGDLAAERRELRHVAGRFEGDEHADLAEPLVDSVVHVAGDDALGDFELGDTAQRHVLADGGDELLQALAHRRLGAGEMRCFETPDGAVAHEGDLGGLASEGLEGVVAGHEIGLGVDLDDRSGAARRFDRDEAFGGDAPGLLGGLGQALLAQPIDGRLDVAVRFGEGGLAIHHARAGLVAELLHHRGGDVRHGWSFHFVDRAKPGRSRERRAIGSVRFASGASGVRRPRSGCAPGRASCRDRCGRAA